MHIRSQLDRKAPRFRQTCVRLLNSKMVKRFREKYPQYSHYSDQNILDAILVFNGMLWQAVIEHRDGVELPEGMGNVFIGSCKSPKKFNRDHNQSNLLGVDVANRNLGSDGYLAKIFYTNCKTKYRFRNRNLWMFKGDRKFTNAVSRTYREEWPKYIVVEDYKKISTFFTNQRIQRYRENVISGRKVADDYNEFDLD